MNHESRDSYHLRSAAIRGNAVFKVSAYAIATITFGVLAWAGFPAAFMLAIRASRWGIEKFVPQAPDSLMVIVATWCMLSMFRYYGHAFRLTIQWIGNHEGRSSI